MQKAICEISKFYSHSILMHDQQALVFYKVPYACRTGSFLPQTLAKSEWLVDISMPWCHFLKEQPYYVDRCLTATEIQEEKY